jgi:hypothetical protein
VNVSAIDNSDGHMAVNLLGQTLILEGRNATQCGHCGLSLCLSSALDTHDWKANLIVGVIRATRGEGASLMHAACAERLHAKANDMRDARHARDSARWPSGAVTFRMSEHALCTCDAGKDGQCAIRCGTPSRRVHLSQDAASGGRVAIVLRKDGASPTSVKCAHVSCLPVQHAVHMGTPACVATFVDATFDAHRAWEDKSELRLHLFPWTHLRTIQGAAGRELHAFRAEVTCSIANYNVSTSTLPRALKAYLYCMAANANRTRATLVHRQRDAGARAMGTVTRIAARKTPTATAWENHILCHIRRATSSRACDICSSLRSEMGCHPILSANQDAADAVMRGDATLVGDLCVRASVANDVLLVCLYEHLAPASNMACTCQADCATGRE